MTEQAETELIDNTFHADEPAAVEKEAPVSVDKARDTGGRFAKGKIEKGDKAPDAPKPSWEAPGYTSMWKEQHREALEWLATNQDQETQKRAKEIQGRIEEYNQHNTRTEQALSQYRKRFDPVAELLGQAEQQYAMQGMSLDGGLRQLFTAARMMAQDPDNTFPWIAQLYRPRDAAKVVQALSQHWGVNLGEVAQGQPFVDPHVQQIVTGLRGELQTLQQARYQEQQQQRMQYQNNVINACTQFEQEKDASGALTHPHVQKVGPDMAILLHSGRAQNLQQAYDMACRMNPDVSQELVKQAEQKAREQAARTTSETQQAAAAARNVSGKPNGQRSQPATRREAYEKAKRELEARS